MNCKFLAAFFLLFTNVGLSAQSRLYDENGHFAGKIEWFHAAVFRDWGGDTISKEAQKKWEKVENTVVEKVYKRLYCVPIEYHEKRIKALFYKEYNYILVHVEKGKEPTYRVGDEQLLEVCHELKDTWMGLAVDEPTTFFIPILYQLRKDGILQDLRTQGMIVVRTSNVLKEGDWGQYPFDLTRKSLFLDSTGYLRCHTPFKAKQKSAWWRTDSHLASAIYRRLCYPSEAREKYIEGLVVAHVYRDKKGKLTTRIVKSAHPILDEVLINSISEIDTFLFKEGDEYYIPVRFEIVYNQLYDDLELYNAVVIHTNQIPEIRFLAW